MSHFDDTAGPAEVSVSVIIPVLNEAEVISECLDAFDNEGVDVLVVDGGSTDGTASIVEASGVAELLVADIKGRASQMNTGAEAAAGSVLLFLHADCRLPEDWRVKVGEALANPEVVGGRFQLGIAESTLSFRLIAFFSTLRSRVLKITYGDQAIFVRRSVFESVGGFPDRRIFEDSEFCDVLERRGRFVMLDAKVISSSRRWRAWGIWRTVFRMWVLRIMYTLSVSDERLSRWYRNVR